MKAIAIKQPWASLICNGIKDVECRSWKPAKLPVRVLVVASSTKATTKLEMLPTACAAEVENAQVMGKIPALKDLTTSAIIGCVTICEAKESVDSVWNDDMSQFNWTLKDPVLFKEPITGIKGKLNIYEIPEYTEENLPEAIDPFGPDAKNYQIEGDVVTMPVTKAIFENILAYPEGSFNLNIPETRVQDKVTLPGLLKIDGDLWVAEKFSKVRFVCDSEVIEADVKDCFVGRSADEEGNPLDMEDFDGNLYPWNVWVVEYENVKRV